MELSYAKIQEILFDIKQNNLNIMINKYFTCSINIDQNLINFFQDIIQGKETEINTNQICLLSNKEIITIYDDNFKFSFENNNFLRNEIRNIIKNLQNLFPKKLDLEKEYREFLLQNLDQYDIIDVLNYQTLREYCETSCDLDLYMSRVRRLTLALIFLLEDENLDKKIHMKLENILTYIEKEFPKPNYIQPEYTIRYIYNNLKKLYKNKKIDKNIIRQIKYFSKFSDLYTLKSEDINNIIREFLYLIQKRGVEDENDCDNEEYIEFRVTVSLLKTIYQPYWYFNGLLIHKDFAAISVHDHIFQIDTNVHTLYDNNFVKKYGELNQKDNLYYYISNYTYDIIEFNKVFFPIWLNRLPSFCENYTFEINKTNHYDLKNDSEYIFDEYKDTALPSFSDTNILQEYCEKYAIFDEITNQYYYTSLKDYSCYTHVMQDNKLRSQLIETLLKYQYEVSGVLISQTKSWNDIYYLFELENIQNNLMQIIEKTHDNVAKSLYEKISVNFHTKFYTENIVKDVKIFNEYYWEYNKMLIPNYINCILANDQKSYIYKNNTFVQYNYISHHEIPLYLSQKEYLDNYAIYNIQTQKYYFKPHLKDYKCFTEDSLEEKYLYQLIFILEELNDFEFHKLKNLNILNFKNENREIFKSLIEKIKILNTYDINIIQNLIKFLEKLYHVKRSMFELEFTSYDFIQL